MEYCFNIGDTVRMKLGGPELTVTRILGNNKEDKFIFIDHFGYDEGDVICDWLDGDNKKCDIFRKNSIEIVK